MLVFQLLTGMAKSQERQEKGLAEVCTLVRTLESKLDKNLNILMFLAEGETECPRLIMIVPKDDKTGKSWYAAITLQQACITLMLLAT